MPGATQWSIHCHWTWGQLSTPCCNATEVALLAAPSCSLPQPATDHGVGDGRSNWLPLLPTLHRSVPGELHLLVHMLCTKYKTCCSKWDANTRPSIGMPGQRTAYAATLGIKLMCLIIIMIVPYLWVSSLGRYRRELLVWPFIDLFIVCQFYSILLFFFFSCLHLRLLRHTSVSCAAVEDITLAWDPRFVLSSTIKQGRFGIAAKYFFT